MQKDDLEEADRIVRIAFGTYLGLPEPIKFMGDADFVWTRFTTNPSAALAAEVDGKLVGSNFLLDWGSVGVFGPLTIHPSYWDKSIAKALLEETIKIFRKWGTRHLGLFTFAHSAKHVHLYQKFGFWPRFLTAVMSKQLIGSSSSPRSGNAETTHYEQFSSARASKRNEMVESCSALTGQILEGLDLRKEIDAVESQKLGDTILLVDGSNNRDVNGLAICHVGPKTEAGSGNCYIKFAAVKPSENAQKNFDSLLDACEQYALSRGVSKITAGANAARHMQYKRMIELGFRTEMQGVAMQNPNEPGYNRQDVWIIDDWR
jgi:GNAT superfamily N-acetyltransferase